jgi:lipoyl synthase
MSEGNINKETGRRLPSWLKRPVGRGTKFQEVKELLLELRLATVCSSAGCPNQGECFSQGTATFMILGATCTRDCQFCRVAHGTVSPPAADEPARVAEAVSRLQLRHVVITSVTRDDLPDGGADHFARTIQAIRERLENVTIEVLTPDFQGETSCLDTVCEAQPNVFNHNLETSRRLTPEIRSAADYARSLGVLRYVAQKEHGPIVKSGFMVGLGESEEEIDELLRDLRAAGVQMLTIGQYLRPSKENRLEQKFYPPQEFEQMKARAEALGFAHVAAGPFVRSSYHAGLSKQELDETTKDTKKSQK